MLISLKAQLFSFLIILLPGGRCCGKWGVGVNCVCVCVGGGGVAVLESGTLVPVGLISLNLSLSTFFFL